MGGGSSFSKKNAKRGLVQTYRPSYKQVLIEWVACENWSRLALGVRIKQFIYRPTRF